MDFDYICVPGVTDYIGKNATELKKKKLYLFDMDGTIYEEDRVFEGTIDLLNRINEIGGKYIFITNNSSKSVDDYVKKVRALGIQADKDNFFTSGQATALYLTENYKDKVIYCQATESLQNELKDFGISITTEVSEDASVVVVGFDTELTYSKLRSTCEMLQKEIPFIATNPDLRCPVSFGFIPDCGAICNMIEAATNKKPIYIGKPESIMVNLVREKLGFSLEETVVIGDRLYTDIATGINVGVTSICVLTGEATLKEAVLGNIEPTYIFKNIKDIYEIVK